MDLAMASYDGLPNAMASLRLICPSGAANAINFA